MISIIIPVYNAEKFINTCIESIKHQTFKQWELILVDDGSKDRSGQICDKFAQYDKRIKVIHKLNGGVSSARNIGLDQAIGEYIMFVDSDDWLEPDLCQKLFDGIEQCDLAIGGYKAVSKHGQVLHIAKDMRVDFPESFFSVFHVLYEKELLNAPFSKLYKQDVIQALRFDESVKLGEDFLFNLDYISKCRNIAIVATSSYIYNMLNENSATKKFRKDDFVQIVKLYKRSREFADIYGFGEKTRRLMEERFCLNGINLLQLLMCSDFTKNEKKILATTILSNSEFDAACRSNFRLPLKYEIPRKFCISKNQKMLTLFFWVKRIVIRCLKRLF